MSTLSISGVSLTGANPVAFSIMAMPTSTVAGGGNTTFAVRYNATALGANTAQVVIATNDCDEGMYLFASSGTTTAPGASLDFDGIDDRVTVSGTNPNAPLSQITLEA